MEKICFELFNHSGEYHMVVCPFENDELTTSQMNAVDSMFGKPPEGGNNDEAWYELYKKEDIVPGNFEIQGSTGNLLAVGSFGDIALSKNEEKRIALLDAFGGKYILPSKWNMRPIDD